MKTVHIARGNPDIHQDGSYLWPFRVTTAQQFDDVFRISREPAQFLLAPGEFETMGSWAFPKTNYALLPPNASLIGTGGSQATILRLAADYERGDAALAKQALPVLNCGGRLSGPSNQMTVQGITIDASATEGRPSIPLALWTGGALVEDIRILGLAGDWATMTEGFAILIMDSTGACNGGNVVRRCRVECIQASNTYLNGICMGTLDQSGAPNVVEDCFCKATIPEVGKRRAHTAFAAMMNTEIRNCQAEGFDRGVFSDTGNVDGVTVRGCRMDIGCVAVDYPALSMPANPIAMRRRIRVLDCDFTNNFPSGSFAAGISLNDQSPRHDAILVEDITVSGCLFTSAITPGKFYALSVQAVKADRIVFHDCTLPKSAQTSEGVYSPTSMDAVRFTNLTFMR